MGVGERTSMEEEDGGGQEVMFAGMLVPLGVKLGGVPVDAVGDDRLLRV